MQSLQALKGFRDFLPPDKRKRDYAADRIRRTFERYGYDPIETPTIEYASLLLGKYGSEADKLVFTFTDRGGREVALRYDQTVPTARVLSQYRDQFPGGSRRYQIQNVFRSEKPQKGRYREFTQCDADIFGITNPLADAEILAVYAAIYRDLGIDDLVIRINDRTALFSVLAPFATETISIPSMAQTLDKLDKKTESEILDELTAKGMVKDRAITLLNKVKATPIPESLKTIQNHVRTLGFGNIVYHPTLVRGLDYYTGMIFEGIIPSYGEGSVGGGGRYDKLIGQLSGIDIEAVGFGLGFDRTVEAMDLLGKIPSDLASAEVLVTVFDGDSVGPSLSAVRNLRENGISAELYPDTDKLEKQLKYADRKGVPYTIIIGPEEAGKGVVKLKNMRSKEQQEMTIGEVIDVLKKHDISSE